jgi:hypothetical protein
MMPYLMAGVGVGLSLFFVVEGTDRPTRLIGAISLVLVLVGLLA